ncbi:MAG: regulatory iron-sulfur-containing complex subunit RicT [Gemmatimonadota bacterium]
MSGTIEVRFKGNRRGAFAWTVSEASPRVGTAVLVEAERGIDLGFVNAVGDAAEQKCGGCDSCGPGEASAEPERRRVVRLASDADQSQHAERRREEDQVRGEVTARVEALDLDMRISDTEWQWDRQHLTIYFTAPRRVDFRALVRELASRYRTRIDLRQIGVREEAARLGGIGRCGREFCCSTWLTEPGPVNLTLAKDQNLSLNPAQISGGCGRLLCCLKYEHQYYLDARKRFPKEGRVVHTSRGEERVAAVDILREHVVLQDPTGGQRTLALVDFTAETRAGTTTTPHTNAPQEP